MKPDSDQLPRVKTLCTQCFSDPREPVFLSLTKYKMYCISLHSVFRVENSFENKKWTVTGFNWSTILVLMTPANFKRLREQATTTKCSKNAEKKQLQEKTQNLFCVHLWDCTVWKGFLTRETHRAQTDKDYGEKSNFIWLCGVLTSCTT